MTRFLVSNNLRSQELDLICHIVSKKGNDSSSSVFASHVETRGTHLPGINFDIIFDALMIVYVDLWFVNSAIQCFRLVRKHNFRIPVNGCRCLIDKMMKTKPMKNQVVKAKAGDGKADQENVVDLAPEGAVVVALPAQSSGSQQAEMENANVTDELLVSFMLAHNREEVLRGAGCLGGSCAVHPKQVQRMVLARSHCQTQTGSKQPHAYWYAY
ncbi:hypothetical protein ACOSQ3_013172 [Xanthoceras sorbifolium]